MHPDSSAHSLWRGEFTKQALRTLLCASALALLQACGGSSPAGDAGTRDSGPADSGTPDAGSLDSGSADAGAPDAGNEDAGNSDAGTRDGGSPDGGVADSGTPDAGTHDGGAPDAGPLTFSTFTASPPDIAAGSSTTLSWTVSGETSLALTQAGGSSISFSGGSVSVTPTASTTYLMRASSGSGSVTLPVTVTVRPATPLPLVEQFTADVSRLKSGASTTLRWTVDNASSVTISSLSGTGASGTASVTPATTTTYTLAATGPGGSATASATVAVDAAALIAPGDAGTGDIQIVLDSSQAEHPISPYVYGYNSGTPAGAPPGTALLRQGGNRWTAYNWETNASNAGSDYFYESDDYLTASNVPGEALLPSLAEAQDAGQGMVATIPIQGWVAADESGPVNVSAPNIDRFLPIAPRKGAAFASSPDLTDHLVYGDELAHALAVAWSSSAPLMFQLDNEPDLWASTHAEIEKNPITNQNAPVTYQELFDKSIAASSAIKDAVPHALITGPISYGWAGYQNLQNASDANNRDFLETYLSTFQAESAAQGRRLLDVLDLHWYSEATGLNASNNATRVTNDDNSTGVVAARVQSPRSLWDTSYIETSWITQYTTNGGGIYLVPRMLAKIAAKFPGTRLSLSEYNHGGGDDISGAVAEADVLGILGQQGVYFATYWPLLQNDNYTYGAFRAFRDYDGAGAKFGDTSFLATSSNVAQVSVYGSFDAGNANRIVLVLINRDTAAHTAHLSLKHTAALSTYSVWQIATSGIAAGTDVIPTHVTSAAALPATNAFFISLPKMSVSTVELLK